MDVNNAVDIGVDEHHETEDRKSRLRAEEEKSRLHARISFCSIP